MPDPKHLRPEEKRAYRAYVSGWKDRRGVMRMAPDKGMADTLESLSACRGLLKDAKLYLQSYEMASEREGFKGTPHHDGIKKMVEAIAAQLEGVE